MEHQLKGLICNMLPVLVHKTFKAHS